MTAEAPLRALVVDDEPLAVERLQILCAGIDRVEVIGTAADGAAALRLVEALRPDLLLLDVAMPGMDGMSVARALEALAKPPAIIFVTAFDSFAVEAFDLEAVDYLLKPVAAERLARAVRRIAVARNGQSERPPATEYTEEFWVPQRSEMIRIAATDIERIEAERDYMRLHVGARSYLLHQTISALEQRLDPARFLRLHRSTIVRRDWIAKLAHDGLGVWHAELNDGTRVRIGRTYMAAAKAVAGR